MTLAEIDLEDFRLLNIHAENWDIVELAYQYFGQLHSVKPSLVEIAMNPCRFLGLASSISRSPQSIVFSTAGMDPLGFKKLHKYAIAQFDGTLIHLDVRPCEHCQTNGQSIEIDAKLQVIAR